MGIGNVELIFPESDAGGQLELSGGAAMLTEIEQEHTVLVENLDAPGQ